MLFFILFSEFSLVVIFFCSKSDQKKKKKKKLSKAPGIGPSAFRFDSFSPNFLRVFRVCMYCTHRDSRNFEKFSPILTLPKCPCTPQHYMELIYCGNCMTRFPSPCLSGGALISL